MERHFSALANLSLQQLHHLLERISFFEKTPSHQLPQILKHKLIANLFFEASTRTRLSFEAAEKRLGAEVLNFSPETSSVTKGETLYDTLRTVESLGVDAMVIRHSDDKLFEEYAPRINTPLINAGAGKYEHPSQGLLDLYTIYKEFGHWENLHVAIVGDIRHSRVAGSLLTTGPKLGLTFSLCGPQSFLPHIGDWSRLDQSAIQIAPLDESLKKADVVMCLRNQFERHQGQLIKPESFLADWGLNLQRASLLKKTTIIMHPAPVNRNIEIADELIECPQSRIFQQMANGVFARMAILEHMLVNQKKLTHEFSKETK